MSVRHTHRDAHVGHGDDVSVLHQVDRSVLNIEPAVGLVVTVMREVSGVPLGSRGMVTAT